MRSPELWHIQSCNLEIIACKHCSTVAVSGLELVLRVALREGESPAAATACCGARSRSGVQLRFRSLRATARGAVHGEAGEEHNKWKGI